MTLRGLHTVLCLMLALLYVVERGLPCVDECMKQENDPHAQVAHADEEHGSSDDAQHHCDHCSCVCHVPALTPAAIEAGPLPMPSVPASSYLEAVPTAPVSPPDHIPLV